MDIGRILTRSIEIGWRYRVLWALGLIFALFGGGSSSSPGNTFNFQTSRNEFPPGANLSSVMQTLQVIFIAFICLALIWLVLTLYFRFVARGAMVAAVRAIEGGTPLKFGAAWREGSKYWGRLLGLGLLVNVPLTIVTLVLLGVTLLPMLGTLGPIINQAVQGGQIPRDQLNAFFSGLAGFILLFCCALLCLAILGLVIHPIYQFAVRAIVLDEQGVTAGLTRGYRQVTANLGQVALLYLALIGCRILFGIVVGVITLPLAFVIGAVVAAASQQSSLSTGVLLSLCLTIPVALLMLLLEAVFQIFEQNAWTLGYMALPGNRQLAPVATVPGTDQGYQPPPAPAVEG